MKKICFITTVSSTIKAFLIDLIRELDLMGYEITVICDDDPSMTNILPGNVKYIPIKMRRGINIFEPFRVVFSLVKIFRDERFDLIQYSTPNASLYSSIAGFIAKVPVRLYCQWGIVFVSFSGIKYKIFREIERLICSLSTKVEPDSYGNLEFSRKLGLYSVEKSHVIWNGSAAGVDLKKFDINKKKNWRQTIRKEKKISKDDIVIGFVGRINRDKGLNELLSAYKGLLEKVSNVKLIIIGGEDNINELDSNLFQWSLKEPSVIYCGHVDNVEHYLSTMDIFVLPSYREGFGSVIIEAEAMGLPVIVTDIPGPTDAMIPNKTGLVVPKKDAYSLLNSMEILVNNISLRNFMSKEAIEFSTNNFNKQHLLKHIIADREKLLGVKE